MIHPRARERLVQQQKLHRELAEVLMDISVTAKSIARNLNLLSMQKCEKGVNPYVK